MKYCLVSRDENNVDKDVEVFENEQDALDAYEKMKEHYAANKDKYTSKPWDLYVYKVSELANGQEVYDLVCSTKPE